MSTRERPQCRHMIEKEGLRPYLVNGEWDGFRCVDPDGRHSHMSGGLRMQMKQMVAEGYWDQPSGTQLSGENGSDQCRSGEGK